VPRERACEISWHQHCNPPKKKMEKMQVSFGCRQLPRHVVRYVLPRDDLRSTIVEGRAYGICKFHAHRDGPWNACDSVIRAGIAHCPCLKRPSAARRIELIGVVLRPIDRHGYLQACAACQSSYDPVAFKTVQGFCCYMPPRWQVQAPWRICVALLCTDAPRKLARVLGAKATTLTW
jgi:hypothetical protein